jgi:hypothetical protein
MTRKFLVLTGAVLFLSALHLEPAAAQWMHRGGFGFGMPRFDDGFAMRRFDRDDFRFRRFDRDDFRRFDRDDFRFRRWY